MPGVGGLSIANNLLSNSIQLNLNRNQGSLRKVTAQLSSGLRVTGPSDDPSGFSIATNLQTQVDSFDKASQNVQDAKNAATVASGALTTVTSILQKIRTLAVGAGSNLLSESDRGNIQTEINQLLAEVNNIASNTQFNGLSLLDGSKAGYQAPVNATALVTQNSPLNSQQSANLVNGVSISSSSAGIVDGTLQFQVVQTGITISTQVFYITSTGLAGILLTTVDNFGQGTPAAPLGVAIGFIGGQSTGFTYTDVVAATGTEDLFITLSSVVTSDIGSSTFVKISQFVSSTNYATTTALSVQSGANQGQIVSFNIQSVTASALRISNLNVFATNEGFSVLSSQDAIGQIDKALNQVLTLQANIGAVVVRLTQQEDNNNLASVNLQASESTIRDLNVAQASTEYTKDQLLISFGTSLLAQANINAQSVLTLFR